MMYVETNAQGTFLVIENENGRVIDMIEIPF